MTPPPFITYRGLTGIDWLNADIERRAARLERYYPMITTCRIAVGFVNRRHENGNRYHIRIDVTVPRERIVVSHEAALGGSERTGLTAATKRMELDRGRRYVTVAVREAFDAARRRLEDYRRRQVGDVKAHTRVPRGRTIRTAVRP
jgi:hypothetical protein